MDDLKKRIEEFVRTLSTEDIVVEAVVEAAVETFQTMHEVNRTVDDLKHLIEHHGWQEKFLEAIKLAKQYGTLNNFKELDDIETLDDYYAWLQASLTWFPQQDYEHGDGRSVYDKIVQFYWVLDQDPVKALQTLPQDEPEELSPLSKWIVDYAVSWGAYLDLPVSAKHVKTFKDDPFFTWDEYMPPPASYIGEPQVKDNDWKAYRTFNQFFARHMKPGMRPIAGLQDNRVVVSPADCTFVGAWTIDQQSNIYAKQDSKDIKGLKWSIEELLEGSPYADRFKGGVFTHSFLNSINYHRWHTPVQGKVLEARVIQGYTYLDVNVVDALDDGEPVKRLNALDGTGWQFFQTRGLIVIDSPIGLVACLPMGMAQVSSVVITADVGVTLHKGEELGYFQFGGSDFVMVFERACNLQLINQPGVLYPQGSWIGNAFPYDNQV